MGAIEYNGTQPSDGLENIKKEGLISGRQVEEYKGREKRFIQSISGLPADVKISQNHSIVQKRELISHKCVAV